MNRLTLNLVFCDRETMDEKIKQLLRELGNAINASISASPDVNQHIQRIRDEGYNLYVVLDATIGLGKNGEAEKNGDPAKMPPLSEASFRININDLGFLRSIGIDPTRKVKVPKRLEAKTGDTE
jgi:hypothetical protein